MTKTNAFPTKLSWLGAFGLLGMMCGCGAFTPPQTTDIANLVAADTPAGACLIEYNDALATGRPLLPHRGRRQHVRPQNAVQCAKRIRLLSVLFNREYDVWPDVLPLREQ